MGTMNIIIIFKTTWNCACNGLSFHAILNLIEGMVHFSGRKGSNHEKHVFNIIADLSWTLVTIPGGSGEICWSMDPSFQVGVVKSVDLSPWNPATIPGGCGEISWYVHGT